MYCKLTNEYNRTRDGFTNCLQWGVGITHEASGYGHTLYSDKWIYCYADPLIAVLRDCQEGRYCPFAHLWECLGEGEHLSDGLKWGFKKLTTLRELPLPKVTPEQRVHWGILCSLEVYKEQRYAKWAAAWLRGAGRKDGKAIQKVAHAAFDDPNASHEAGNAACYAAMAAQGAAKCTTAPLSATISTNAAKAAGCAAAAKAAKAYSPAIDFAALAHRAVEEEKLVHVPEELS